MFTYCPSCQKAEINFIDKRYFQCRHCDFCYYHNVASAVAGIIQFQDKILLTTRAKNPGKNMLDLPGGFVDPNESLEQALSREVKEELGLSINNWNYLCSFPNQYQYKEITYQTQDCFFFTQLKSLPKLMLEKSEISNAQWVTIKNIDINQVAFPSVSQGINFFTKKQFINPSI